MIQLKRGRVVHAVPGRVRVKMDPGDLSGGSSDELRSALLAMPGVDEVKVNRLSGSIVIKYDRESLDGPKLLELARTARLLALDALDPDEYANRNKPSSQTALGIKRTFHEVDVRLSDLTRGRWDLRSVVPVAFGALAVRAIVRDFGSLQTVPWYVLAWYAFDSFWKLNEQRQLQAPEDRTFEDEE